MIEASYHDSVNVLQDLTCVQSATPFDRSEWFALLAQTGIKPFVAVASEDANSAALMITRNNGHITSMRNWYSFTWRECAPTGETGNRLLTAIARKLRSTAYRVTLEPVPGETGSQERLARAFADAGWKVKVDPCETNHVLPVRGRNFAEYWAERPGRLRTTLSRKAKRVETEIHTHFDARAWSHYEAIYSDSWKPQEDYPAMLREFAKSEGDAGRLRLGLARHEGVPVAAQCWTVENGTAYIHKLAHLESHKRLSAGTTLSAALFEYVIDKDRVSLVDFGNGNEPYKADWMEEKRSRYRIDCIDPMAPRGWLALARRAASRIVR